MEIKAHGYRVGSNEQWLDELPAEEEQLVKSARKHIEPWLSAVFQAEHLNLLVGSDFLPRSQSLQMPRQPGWQ